MKRPRTVAGLVGLAALALSMTGGGLAVRAGDGDAEERALALNQEGVGLYRAGRYREAEARFEQALLLLGEQGSSFSHDLELNRANALHMQGDLPRARELYERLLREDPSRAPRYRRELGLLLAKLRPRCAPGRLAVSGDARLVRLTRELLPLFPGIQRPIELRMLSPEENSPAYLRQLGLPTVQVAIAQGTTYPDRHELLFNGEFWDEAGDLELLGDLAHELMHKEWSDLGLDMTLFSGSEDTLRYASLEHVIDYCVVAKGLAEPLFRAKVYVLERTGPEHLRGDIAPNAFHLADVLWRASRFEMAGAGTACRQVPVPQGIAPDVQERLGAFSWHRAEAVQK